MINELENRLRGDFDAETPGRDRSHVCRQALMRAKLGETVL